MFTGIIETKGIIKELIKESSNLHISVQSNITSELKIDQSVAHNGVCLTVVKIKDDVYTVTAIDETLQKTNLGQLKTGAEINLERCMAANGRFDGHIVQGHVDQTAICKQVEDLNGSWKYTFSYPQINGNITVEKGSICVNGVSLTVVDSKPGEFSVAIIPYTHEHTNFKHLQAGDAVNIEFDVIGKYVAKMLDLNHSK